MKHTVASELASRIVAIENCHKSGNAEWLEKHSDALKRLARDFLPSGSGFDNGTSIDRFACTPSRLVFRTHYHHMNDGGYYDGWTEHRVTVISTFNGPDIRIGGRDRNGIKDFIADAFLEALPREIPDEYWKTLSK